MICCVNCTLKETCEQGDHTECNLETTGCVCPLDENYTWTEAMEAFGKEPTETILNTWRPA